MHADETVASETSPLLATRARLCVKACKNSSNEPLRGRDVDHGGAVF
jgi:hypothetical protein